MVPDDGYAAERLVVLAFLRSLFFVPLRNGDALRLDNLEVL